MVSNKLNINLDILLKYEEDGWIVKQSHPSLPLYIWNYSRNCQYKSYWNEITLNCRSLVTDFEGNIVARGFKKFFNLEEHKENEIPNESFEVYEKLDGSLILAFQYNNNWIICSKGSFVSEQAVAAEKLFYKLNYNSYFRNNYGHTYIFEYLSDWNRIVVKYNEERLVLIALVDSKTTNEINIQPLASDFFRKEVGFVDIVKKYDGISDYRKLRELFSGDNREGFVVKFKSGFRIKLKYEEYIRLHRIITNITSYDIWETLKTGGDIEQLLDNVPDEFDNWVKNKVNEINNEFRNLKKEIEKEFWGLINKKDIAEKFKKSNYTHYLFKRLNTYSEELDEMIWNNIKPKFEKPFNSKIKNK